MRVLFFVDTHGMEEFMPELASKARNADIIVCAGDFTIFENNMHAILSRFNSLGKKLLIIHGNHEEAASISNEISEMKNITLIHKTYHIEGDIVFFGYGGGGFAVNDPKFDIVAGEFVKELRRIEEKDGRKYRIALITHAPPHGTRIDHFGNHVGCKNITEFIKRHKPIISISGHLHDFAGMEDKIGETIIINPGPRGMIVEI